MAGPRRYRVYGGPGQTLLDIQDGASPYLQTLAVRFPTYTDRALRHMAWWLRGVVKGEMRQSSPGGRRWAKAAGVTRYRVLEAFKRSGKIRRYTRLSRPRKGGASWPEAGALTNAVGYEHPRLMAVAVGWLSRSAVRLGIRFQGGNKTRVTNKMRALYRAAGVPLKAGKREIEQPARPVFEPIFRARRVEIGTKIEQRVDLYLTQLALSYQLRAG